MSYLEYIKAFGHIKFEQLKDNLNHKKLSTLDTSQKKLLHELNLFGVTVIPNYYSIEECEKIKTNIDDMISNNTIKKWYDDSKSDSRIFASHKYSESIKKFHEDPFLKKLGEAYTKSELINSHTLGAKLIATENNFGSGGGWHRDSVFKIQYKSIAYLSDVNIDNGPFEYLLGSHKKSTILKSIKENKFKAHHNRFSEEDIQQFKESNPSINSKVFTAKKGTVILVDTSGIHRGTPIKSGNRYALTNYFFPKHHHTNSQRKKFEALF
ncbi:MAG: phytanoyl-CoA dioxygenase family protein [Flavobacteriales bacterium]|nr:phytanoyl-CoA dioxygenase family protein [Flavobacteriales bacterium]